MTGGEVHIVAAPHVCAPASRGRLKTILSVERRTNPLKNVENDGVRFIAASFGFVLRLSGLVLGGAPEALVTKAEVKVRRSHIDSSLGADVEASDNF